MSANDVIAGVLKLLQLPDRETFTGIPDLLQRIPQLYGVELPSSITNVTVGTAAPGDDERDHLWVRIDNSSNFVGLYIYVTGAWRQIYPLPQQLFLIFGDSRAVPDGYTFVENDPRITAEQRINLKKVWTQGGTSPVWYSVFHVTFTGF